MNPEAEETPTHVFFFCKTISAVIPANTSTADLGNIRDNFSRSCFRSCSRDKERERDLSFCKATHIAGLFAI